MIYVFSFLLMAAVLGYIALPLFRGVREETGTGDQEVSELQAQKMATYNAIKELRFDYEMGNLSVTDHQELEEKYKTKAAEILKELDGVKSQLPGDDVENEILRRRKAGRARVADEIERRIASRRAGAVTKEVASRLCLRCGKPQKAEAKFCSSCGGPLKLACPGCGTPYLPDDRFCSRCGAALKKEKKA